MENAYWAIDNDDQNNPIVSGQLCTLPAAPDAPSPDDEIGVIVEQFLKSNDIDSLELLGCDFDEKMFEDTFVCNATIENASDFNWLGISDGNAATLPIAEQPPATEQTTSELQAICANCNNTKIGVTLEITQQPRSVFKFSYQSQIGKTKSKTINGALKLIENIQQQQQQGNSYNYLIGCELYETCERLSCHRIIHGSCPAADLAPILFEMQEQSNGEYTCQIDNLHILATKSHCEKTVLLSKYAEQLKLNENIGGTTPLSPRQEAAIEAQFFQNHTHPGHNISNLCLRFRAYRTCEHGYIKPLNAVKFSSTICKATQ